ncbi:MAG: homocysteine S-methyltransferase family protein, partial [Clostridia bacterium]|nr:homocysteine S-methyltransferase family protein [Clostridia bacterium]
MDLLTYLKNNVIYLDGGMGTLLHASGLKRGELPERWNVTHPDIITSIHKSYYESGSNVVSTNTFGANILKFSLDELEEIIGSAIANAKRAREESAGGSHKWIALDIGPTGRMLAPYGDLSFESAVEVFKKTVEIGVRYGVDLVLIETMSDSYETKAALLAVKETTDLPVFVSNAYGENGALLTGATPKSMVALLEGMGADAIGVNCSFGPEMLAPICREYLKYASVPVLLKPNAGLPKVVNGETIYDISAEKFATECKALMEEGVRVAGGCCGTTPEYVKALYEATKGMDAKEITEKCETLVTS